MKIKILKDYAGGKAGEIVEASFPGGDKQEYIDNGFIEIIGENDVKIKIIKDYDGLKKGEIIHAKKADAEAYIKNGFAEYIEKNNDTSPVSIIERNTNVRINKGSEKVKKTTPEKGSEKVNKTTPENTLLENFVVNVVFVVSPEKYNKYNKYNNTTNTTIKYNDVFTKENQVNKIKWAMFCLSSLNKEFEGLDYSQISKISDSRNIRGISVIVDRMKTSGQIELYNKTYNKKSTKHKKTYILTETEKNEVIELIENIYITRIEETKKVLKINEYKDKLNASVLNLMEEFGENEDAWEIINQSIVLDFSKILINNPILADAILDDPIRTIEEMKNNLKGGIMDIFKNKEIRIKNIPKIYNIQNRKVNSSNLDKLYSFDVEVITSTEILPATTLRKFDCPSCGTIINIIQIARADKQEPNRCSCGRRGGFKEISKDILDYRTILCSDNPELIEDSAPSRSKRYHLLGDIANIDEILIQPASKLKIVGIPVLKETKQGDEIDVDVCWIETNDELLVLNFSEEDKEAFKDFSKINPMKAIKEEVFDISTSGHDSVKKGLILQQVGGVRKKLNNGIKKRGDIHVGLAGDPASSKSLMASSAKKLSTRCAVADSNRGTSAGLTGTFEFNQQLGKKVRMPGMFDKAKGGLLIWEEFNEADESVQATLKTPLESSEYSVSLATGNLTSECPFAFLFTLNPKNGNYIDQSKPVMQQIPLNPALKTRIDLIFGGFIKPKKVEEIELILEKQDLNEDIDEDRFKFLKKYLAYCKLRTTAIPIEIKTLINGFCLGLISNTDANFRIKDTLNKLVEAFAKIELREEANKDDFENAKNLFLDSLRSTSIVKLDGTQDLDLDRFVETPASDIKDINSIKILINTTLKNHDSYTKKELYLASGLGSARFTYLFDLMLSKKLIDKDKIIKENKQ